MLSETGDSGDIRGTKQVGRLLREVHNWLLNIGLEEHIMIVIGIRKILSETFFVIHQFNCNCEVEISYAI
jgi:hypothetical protein